MPRIFTSRNDPLDFCKRCFPGEKTAQARYSALGDGPDDRGNCFDYDAEHPSYDEQFPAYKCATCGHKLGEKDNYTDQ